MCVIENFTNPFIKPTINEIRYSTLFKIGYNRYNRFNAYKLKQIFGLIAMFLELISRI